MSETGTVQRDVLHCADCGWLVLIKKHAAVRDRYRCNLWRDMVTGEPGDCHTLRTTEAFCGKKATEFKPPTLEEMARQKDAVAPAEQRPGRCLGLLGVQNRDPCIECGRYDCARNGPDPVETDGEGRRCPECGREIEESRRDGMLHLQCPERAVCGWAAFACEVEGCAGLLARFSTRVDNIVRACTVNASHPDFPEAATKPAVETPKCPRCHADLEVEPPSGGFQRCSSTQCGWYGKAEGAASNPSAETSQPCTATGANCTCGHSHP